MLYGRISFTVFLNFSSIVLLQEPLGSSIYLLAGEKLAYRVLIKMANVIMQGIRFIPVFNPHTDLRQYHLALVINEELLEGESGSPGGFHHTLHTRSEVKRALTRASLSQ